MDLSFAVGIAIGVILVVLFAAVTTNAIAELVELVKLSARLYQTLVRQRDYGRVVPGSRVAKRQ
jgi:hypothetical protein